jgi:hypothetical protein
MAHAVIDDARADNLFGEWSDLIVGERPEGLVSCYLVKDGSTVRVAAIWSDRSAHDRALHDEATHPAYRVFDAAGADPEHAVMDVIGVMGDHAHG